MATVSVEISQSLIGISRDDILKFPFPYKLWIVVNLPTSNIINWNLDGTIIQVNLQRLQEYLHSSRSIFVIKTTSQFLKHLEDFQFSRLEDTFPGGTVVELSYHHKNFQRHRLDLVGKIRRLTFFNLDNAQNAELQASTAAEAKSTSGSQPATGCTARMRAGGDLCFMEHGLLTDMQKKRICSETVYAFARESKVLQEKLKKAESKVNMGCASSKRGRSACLEREQIVVLPKDIYENPYDSILAGKGGFQGCKYGGYYGNCTVEQIENFFGEYLPKYSEGGVLKVKNFENNAEVNGQGDKSPETTEKTESSYLADETSTSVNSESLVPIDVDNFVTKSSNEVSKLLGAPKIDISASFNCTSGELEYSYRITKVPDNGILMPPLEAENSMSTELSEAPTTAAAAEPIRPQDENTDFYDDLRATFELLQNQQY